MKKAFKTMIAFSFIANCLGGPAALAQEVSGDSLIGICPQKLAEDGDLEAALFANFKGLWSGIQTNRLKQTASVEANKKRLLTEFRVPLKPLLFLRNLRTLRPFMEKMRELLVSADFKALRGSPAFASILASQDFMSFLLKADVKKYQEGKFKDFMTEIQQILSAEGVLTALKATAVDEVDLSKVENIDSALALDGFFQSFSLDQIKAYIKIHRAILNLEKSASPNLADLQALRAKLFLAKDLAYPSALKIKGVVADNYRELMKSEVSSFLKFYQPGQIGDADSVFANKDEESASTITFDSWILPIYEEQTGKQLQVSFNGKIQTVSKEQLVAIDGLARTLNGEVNTCEGAGIEQATLVAKIVADRAKAIAFTESRMKENEDIVKSSQKNGQGLFSQTEGVDADDFAAALKFSKKAIYGGKSDFGRSDTSEVPLASHPVTQAISRGNQFSGWRSVSKLKIQVVTGHPNLPDVEVQINKELGQGDISALYNQLCPNTATSRWTRMVNLAKSVVLDPEFGNKVKWNQKMPQAPLFYTHAVRLDFVNEIGLPVMVDKRSSDVRMTPSENVKYKAKSAACPQVRLWVSKNAVRYFPDPSVK